VNATVIQTLAEAGFGKRIGLDWLGRKFDIPKPEAGEETLGAEGVSPKNPIQPNQIL
jgi:hypothetical protein